MQIYVLIPIPHPTYPGPDPPENIYHYTTGLKLRSIINSGAIKPTTAKIEPNEKPVAWFSTQDQWEPTATKVPIPGKQGQLLTAKAQSGLVRITVPGTCAPHVFPQLHLIAWTFGRDRGRPNMAGSTAGSALSNWREEPISNCPLGRGCTLKATDAPLARCALLT